MESRGTDSFLSNEFTLKYFCLLLQGLLKKHDAFEKDFEVHKDRVKDIENVGQGLLAEVHLLCNHDMRYLWLYFVMSGNVR